jgi:hypothetical protein
MSKNARPAFRPPTVPPKPLSEEQVRELAASKLADPGYTPGQVTEAVTAELGPEPAAAEATATMPAIAAISNRGKMGGNGKAGYEALSQSVESETDHSPTPDATSEAKTPSAPGKGYPWAKADPRLKVIFSMRLPEELHMKLSYLLERSTSKSIHAICLDSIERTVAKMLKDLEK